MRVICSAALCVALFCLRPCALCARPVEDPIFAPVSGELSLVDPASGRAKSLLKLDGQSLGKPVVLGNTIYVASSAPMLHALDSQTGKVLWQFTPPAAIFSITATPKAIFAGAGGKLIALDPATGAVLWTYDGDIPIADLVIADGLVVFNTVDGPVALDRQMGKFRWRLAIQWGYFVFSPLSEGRLCVWKPDEIFVVETETGKTLWQNAADQSVSAPGALPTPAVAATDLICQIRGTPRDADDWQLIARDAGSGRQLWKTPLAQMEATSPKAAILDKSAYCVLNDRLFAVNIADGRLQWQATIKPLEAGGPGLVAAQGLLYVPELGGEITALDEKTGKIKWIAGAPKASPHGQIRLGGTFAGEAGLYITRNDQVRQ